MKLLCYTCRTCRRWDCLEQSLLLVQWKRLCECILHIISGVMMFKVRSTEEGILIPNSFIGLPAGIEFSLRVGKYFITLEPEGLTDRTSGLVRVGNIDMDEEIGRMVESRVVR